MENRTRKKRTQGASSQNRNSNPAGRGIVNRKSSSGEKSSLQPTEVHVRPVHSALGMSLNPETARQAMILSEIIGKPVSKRGRRRF